MAISFRDDLTEIQQASISSQMGSLVVCAANLTRADHEDASAQDAKLVVTNPTGPLHGEGPRGFVLPALLSGLFARRTHERNRQDFGNVPFHNVPACTGSRPWGWLNLGIHFWFEWLCGSYWYLLDAIQ